MKPASPLVQCNIRMPQDAVDAFDRQVEELNAAEGWAKYTRSDVMRDALLAALKAGEAEKAAPTVKKARKR